MKIKMLLLSTSLMLTSQAVQAMQIPSLVLCSYVAGASGMNAMPYLERTIIKIKTVNPNIKDEDVTKYLVSKFNKLHIDIRSRLLDRGTAMVDIDEAEQVEYKRIYKDRCE